MTDLSFSDRYGKNEGPFYCIMSFLNRVPVWVFLLTCLIALAALVWLYILMVRCDDELKKGKLRAGIVELELAFTHQRANDIVSDWLSDNALNKSKTEEVAITDRNSKTSLLKYAVKSIQIDWWFISAYAVFGFSLFITILRFMKLPINALWFVFSLLTVAAGLFDVGENFFLLNIIAASGNTDPLSVTAASGMAVFKFLLLGLSLSVAVSVAVFKAFARSFQARFLMNSKVNILNFEQVLQAENTYLCSRRILAGLKNGEAGSPIGLALSGGGIRSATVNIGVLQVLMRTDFFRHIDYLCTVSGGGYIGAALSSLLSFRKKYVAEDVSNSSQYEFKPGDIPHFNSISTSINAFDLDLNNPKHRHHQWLSGRMVVDHLRSYGEYLARRRRFVSRDVLRTIGTVISGIASTLALFVLLILILASASGIAIEVAGASLPWIPLDQSNGYWNELWISAGGLRSILLSMAIGGIFLFSMSTLSGLISRAIPGDWFRRDGDTTTESRQHRTLWIVGFLAAFFGFFFFGKIPTSYTIAKNGLLLVPSFFLGGMILTSIVYIALCISASDYPPVRSDPDTRSYMSATSGLFLYLFLLSVVITNIPWILSALQEAGSNNLRKGSMTIISGIGFFSAVVSGLLAWLRKSEMKPEPRLKKLWEWMENIGHSLQKFFLGVGVAVFIVTFLLLAISALISILDLFGYSDPDWVTYLFTALALTFILLFYGYLIDYNKLSLHYFYRDRLVDAYMRTLGTVTNSTTRDLEVKRDDSEMLLSELHGILRKSHQDDCPDTFLQQSVESDWRLRKNIMKMAEVTTTNFSGAATAAPYHIFSTCLNLTTDRDMRLRSRKSDIFIFSKLFCGSNSTGYVDTAVYRSGATKVSRAMTISGAAADSALGRQTFFAQSFASTIFNIRLGQWLENPRYENGAHVHRRENLIFWPKYMLMEVFGMSDTRRRLIHLTDGGHTGDNLGIVPLLQRRCSLILVVDAECDPEYGFNSLMNALYYAEVDLNVKVSIDLSPLEPDENGQTKEHFARGDIHYPKTDSHKEAHGVLLILKSSITPADDELIRKFKKANTKFPHESTIDQFFSEEQFEAYRLLGRAMANSLFKID